MSHENKPSRETGQPGIAVGPAEDAGAKAPEGSVNPAGATAPEGSADTAGELVAAGNPEQSGSGTQADSHSGHKGRVRGDAAELVAVKAELLAVREELAALNDKYLRKLADEVNFRKRMARDKDDARRFAINGFLGDIVPVLDDFDRALSGTVASGNANGATDHLRDGVILIRRQLGQMLENKYGLKRMASVDQPFDPNRHEAVGMETGDTEEPVVCEEYLPGYVVEERVVRTAKVKVRMPAPKPAGNGTDNPDDPEGDGSRSGTANSN
ncbi:MAG: nucleotide exchange factor GrpE [Rectinemataceae bacterium]|nr:nucleotide exchange factor GrpE [Rectinemataceae bacterium]